MTKVYPPAPKGVIRPQLELVTIPYRENLFDPRLIATGFYQEIPELDTLKFWDRFKRENILIPLPKPLTEADLVGDSYFLETGYDTYLHYNRRWKLGPAMPFQDFQISYAWQTGAYYRFGSSNLISGQENLCQDRIQAALLQRFSYACACVKNEVPSYGSLPFEPEQLYQYRQELLAQSDSQTAAYTMNNLVEV